MRKREVRWNLEVEMSLCCFVFLKPFGRKRISDLVAQISFQALVKKIVIRADTSICFVMFC